MQGSQPDNVLGCERCLAKLSYRGRKGAFGASGPLPRPAKGPIGPQGPQRGGQKMGPRAPQRGENRAPRPPWGQGDPPRGSGDPPVGPSSPRVGYVVFFQDYDFGPKPENQKVWISPRVARNGLGTHPIV